jgi:holo-[acyl-carrier protein] synthase
MGSVTASQHLTLSGEMSRALERLLPACAPASLVGLGVDIQDITPFAALSFASNRAFYERVFSEHESAYCLSCAEPAEHFAARFAAKEAVVKAFGTICVLSPVAVEILRLPHGAPTVRLSSEASVLAGVGLRAYVSMAHCEAWACAVAVVTRAELPVSRDTEQELPHV